MAGKNPTYAERLAAVVEGRGSMNFMAAAKQLSLRLPLETLVRVDAFSMSAGMSRNSMIEHLLNAGMEAASAHLDEKRLSNFLNIPLRSFPCFWSRTSKPFEEMNDADSSKEP